MIAALLQARIGSERLPSKVLKELPEGSGVSMLARIITRLKRCEELDEIIVVTPDEPCAVIARKEGVKYSRLIQDKRDVLAEFYHAARSVDTIVRITADCPCICPEMIDKLVRIHLTEKSDYTCSRNDSMIYCNEIDGLDVEVISRDGLERAYKEAVSEYDREHVTSWLYDNVKALVVECGWHFDGEIKLSVDTQDDYNRICKIYDNLSPEFTMRQLREYLGKEK